MNTQDVVRESYVKIHELQKRVFGECWPRDVDEMLQRYYILASKELSEVLEHTNFKQHKAKKPINFEEVGEEIIDVIIFTMAMAGVIYGPGNYDAFAEALSKKVGYNNVRPDWELNRA